MVFRELSIFERKAGELPSDQNKEKYKNTGAVWVLSGGGSYLASIIDTPSDRNYKKYDWYPRQDRARLDYAKDWLDAFSSTSPPDSPILIYNGTEQQNYDLKKAIDAGIFEFSKSRLFIPQGEITKTVEQVKNFVFPPSFITKGKKLAVLSHSAHLPRILRFMKKFPKPFRGVEIVPISINLDSDGSQRQMRDMELENLLGYIEKGEASIEPYPYKI